MDGSSFDVLHMLPDAMVIRDDRGVIVFVNHAAEHLFRTTHPTLLHQSVLPWLDQSTLEQLEAGTIWRVEQYEVALLPLTVATFHGTLVVYRVNPWLDRVLDYHLFIQNQLQKRLLFTLRTTMSVMPPHDSDASFQALKHGMRSMDAVLTMVGLWMKVDRRMTVYHQRVDINGLIDTLIRRLGDYIKLRKETHLLNNPCMVMLDPLLFDQTLSFVLTTLLHHSWWNEAAVLRTRIQRTSTTVGVGILLKVDESAGFREPIDERILTHILEQVGMRVRWRLSTRMVILELHLRVSEPDTTLNDQRE
jgi:hypothetical protein